MTLFNVVFERHGCIYVYVASYIRSKQSCALYGIKCMTICDWIYKNHSKSYIW